MATGLMKEIRIRLTKFVNDLKSNPCVDCKRSFDPCAMDFDHRPEFEKIDYVSRFVARCDEPGLIAEIAKCDLVCACCHRIRTKNRGVSAKTRQKMSENRSGIVKSADARRKMSEAQKKAWAWRKSAQ